jgi:glycosyltransferase involved in cell wall biosynthesis
MPLAARPQYLEEENNSVSAPLRILVTRQSIYPARAYRISAEGLASFRITDLTVKGLAELGHEIHYQVQLGQEPLPEGVHWVGNGPLPRVDVAHRQVDLHVRKLDLPQPWVRTCHTDLAGRGLDRSIAEDNWIFVSSTLARTYGSTRYVVNGIDPSEFIYSQSKGNYFLFIACLDRAAQKGLDVAISLARRAGFKLLVAGSAASAETTADIREKCSHADIELAGEVQGSRKAEMFAGARALLFPTQANEAFGTVMAEALMSGTPVICSNRGACPEIISPEVGFVCDTEQDYLAAIDRVHLIKPADCREKALRQYHYLRMARDYVEQYQQEIGRIPAAARSSSA